ncbi:hypothetical protein LSTR_LSTR007985 [Laodelphax striatellus]|uniref:Uncharacterized protein n=1 Tax=Laodelphax striatellus TaxID=195883 RepID=A0A482X4I8_LAOST|nr:hypothetical protein LSTR_LSTR007985 [Laodelphax striatellus]
MVRNRSIISSSLSFFLRLTEAPVVLVFALLAFVVFVLMLWFLFLSSVVVVVVGEAMPLVVRAAGTGGTVVVAAPPTVPPWAPEVASHLMQHPRPPLAYFPMAPAFALPVS